MQDDKITEMIERNIGRLRRRWHQIRNFWTGFKEPNLCVGRSDQSAEGKVVINTN